LELRPDSGAVSKGSAAPSKSREPRAFSSTGSTFKRHPLGDVGGGVCYCNTVTLAGIEKSNSVNADQGYGAHIHNDVATGGFDLRSNLIQVFYAQGTHKLENYPAPQRLSVDPEYHQLDRALEVDAPCSFRATWGHPREMKPKPFATALVPAVPMAYGRPDARSAEEILPARSR